MEWYLRTSDFSLNESRLLLKYAFGALNIQTKKRTHKPKCKLLKSFYTCSPQLTTQFLIHFLTSIKCRKLRKSKAEHKFSNAKCAWNTKWSPTKNNGRKKIICIAFGIRKIFLRWKKVQCIQADDVHLSLNI